MSVQKWEYMLCYGEDSETIKAALKRAGDDGWELVAVNPRDRDGECFDLFFKRPLA